ncbi:class B sortase [Cohnella abietis]|uniref:SrtB family sortase n=1 Tax=Cohnella abietis TaxID=2507935 RepID=A0A3T1D7U1_9BACL|nr:class B sortase [Cohnella abietis]BBI34151.1 SrtB family sortase [Cohnella abietis]
MNWRKWAYCGILTTAIAVFMFSAVKLTLYFLDARQSNEQIKEARELYHPVPNNDRNIIPQVTPLNEIGSVTQTAATPHIVPLVDKKPAQLLIQDHFKPLLEINKDIIGWVKIDDSNIDYPVVQSDDNSYYLTRDLHGKNNVNGSIFMDYRNAIDKEDKHLILYGHNMKNKSMFMALLNYESRWYFDHHSIIQFDTLYGNQKWQVFSAYYTDAKDDYLKTDFKTDEQFKDFAVSLQSKSLHKTDVILHENDPILTLSTCSNSHDDARFVVHARLISPSIHE